MASQDIAGTYHLSGLYATYQNVARYNVPIIVSDIYPDEDLDITLSIDQIDAGEIYRTTYTGPYGKGTAVGLEVNIIVTFGDDGDGFIQDGSVLPTDDVDSLECTVQRLYTPFTDQLIYSSDLDAGLTAPSTNILGYIPDENNDFVATQQGYVEDGLPVGYENPLIFQGQTTGSISLSQTAEFDFFPAEPVQPDLCDNFGNCFDVILANGETIAGGDPLPGFAGGYVLKGDLPSIAPEENECADLYLEWHAIDGPISGSGMGDEIDDDEDVFDWDGDGNDGDGTDFDRIWAVQSIQVTSLVPGGSCGYNYPVAGDLSLYEDWLEIAEDCIEDNPLVEGNEFYIMNPELSAYGNFYTYNFHFDIEGDDSDHDFNYNNPNEGGRIVWHFDPTCIPDIMVRHIMLEFIEIGGSENCSCPGAWGDVNGDGGWNVLDIVQLSICILEDSCGGSRVDDATFSRLIMKDNMVSIEADGFIGGVQMTLSHGDDFRVKMTDRALIADYLTTGNETRLLVITPETDGLFSYSGDFEITEIIVANSHAEVSVDISIVNGFRISKAYPNPFNPVTSLVLTLPEDGNVMVRVYNINGQVVSTLLSGHRAGGTYNLTWDASQSPSGIYFVKAESAEYIQTQKLMLIK